MSDPSIPRCEHGRILLACPLDDCAEQNEYLNDMGRRLADWQQRQQQEARVIVRSLLGFPNPREGETSRSDTPKEQPQ